MKYAYLYRFTLVIWMSLQTLLLPRCHHHQAPGMNGCPFFWAAFQIWMICMLPPNMKIWYIGILFHMSVPACRCSRSQATCRPNPARKRGMMQHVPFWGSRDTSAKPFGFNWVSVPWSFEVLNMAVVQGIEVSRGNDHLLRHVTWWSRQRPRQPARINQRCRNALPLVYLCLPLPFP